MGTVVAEHIEASLRIVDDANRGVRLLYWTGSGLDHIEQSCLHLDTDGFDRTIPFEAEYLQAFVLCFGVLRTLGWDPSTAPARVAILGGGSGVLPMAIHHVFEEHALVDVVELSRDVISVAREWFGLAESPQLTVHCADALEFLKEPSLGQYNMIVVDIVGNHADRWDTDDGTAVLEMPPRAFVDPEWIRNVAIPTLDPNQGVMAINVVGSRAALAYVNEVFAAEFAWHTCMCTTDDNVVFFGSRSSKAPTAEVLAAVMASGTGRGQSLSELAVEVLESVKKTEDRVAHGHMIGWLQPSQLLALLWTTEFVWSKEESSHSNAKNKMIE